MLRPFIAKLPITVSAPLLVTAPVLAAVLALSILAFIQGRSTANQLASQTLAEIHERIDEQLDALLAIPTRITRINASLIEQEMLDLADIRSWRDIFVEQMRTFDGLSAIAWGGADGQAVWVARHPESTDYELGIKDAKTQQQLREYLLDPSGLIKGPRTEPLDFDPRDQPWFQAAIEANRSTWSGVSAWGHKEGSEVTLGIAFAHPYTGRAGEAIGVINAELSLYDISRFLRNVSIGRDGRGFVMDRQGLLVAASTDAPQTDQVGRQILASSSTDPYIAAVATQLDVAFGELIHVQTPYRDTVMIGADRYLYMVSPYVSDRCMDWLIVTLLPETEFMADVEAGRLRGTVIGLVAVALSVALGIGLAGAMVRPILALVAHVRQVGEGTLENDIRLDDTPELARLSKEINTMVTGLRDRLRMRHSLALAMEVQQNLLPSGTPEIEGLDIAGHSTYCDETGGDYYDFLDISGLSRHAVAVAVGDVAGHGVAAAMLMATARGILRSRCRDPGTIGELLTHVNDLLARDTTGGRFMTMLLLTIDVERYVMRWASAGHSPPIVYDPGGDRFFDLKGGGVPLGIMEQAPYGEYELAEVRSGQVYFASTDGLWEARNDSGARFGLERVREGLRRYAHLSAEAISEHLRADVERFRGAASQHDDVAFVVVKVE